MQTGIGARAEKTRGHPARASTTPWCCLYYPDAETIPSAIPNLGLSARGRADVAQYEGTSETAATRWRFPNTRDFLMRPRNKGSLLPLLESTCEPRSAPPPSSGRPQDSAIFIPRFAPTLLFLFDGRPQDIAILFIRFGSLLYFATKEYRFNIPCCYSVTCCASTPIIAMLRK